MAVSKDYFRSIFSYYYQRTMKFDGLAEYFVSMQHYMFYPIMSLARFNLYAQSLIHSTVGPGSLNSKKYVELVSLFGFWIWLTYFLSLTGSWTNALLYLFVSHAAAGLVHVQICINHFPWKLTMVFHSVLSQMMAIFSHSSWQQQISIVRHSWTSFTVVCSFK